MPEKLVDAVESRCSLGGTVTKDFVESGFKEIKELMARRPYTIVADAALNNSNDLNGGNRVYNDLTARNHYSWGGRYHPVPVNYSVPKYSIRDHWILWHFGNSTENIAPHKYILDTLDLCNKTERANMSKIRMVMEKVLELATMEGNEVNWNNEAEAFNNGFDKLLQMLYNNANKSKNVRIPTIYDLMMKKGLKKRKFSDV
jgi:hypothetical protein